MSIYYSTPTQHPEDYRQIGAPPTGLNQIELWQAGAKQRGLTSDWLSSVEQKEIDPSMIPYAAERIDYNGNYVLDNLSFYEAGEMQMGEHYTGGMWAKSVKNQQLAAIKIFAGRSGLENTELEWAALDDKERELLERHMGEWAGINAIKPIHKHIEPIFTDFYESPQDLFDLPAHAEYDPEDLYDRMWTVKPEFMARIEELGASKAMFEGARNSHEWFFRANSVIQNNFITKSQLWSDDTSGSMKHIGLNLANFAVSGILNDPDMVAEMGIAIVLTLTTGVGGFLYLGGKYGFKAAKLIKAANVASDVAKINRLQRATHWLPSNIPHTILTKGGKLQYHSLHPLKPLFRANAIEGFTTGGVAEWRNQMTQIDYGLREDYDLGLIGWEALIEAGLTPFINPAFNRITRGMGYVGGKMAKGGVITGKYISGQTGFKLSPEFKRSWDLGIAAAKSHSTNARQVEIELTGTINRLNFQTMLGSFKNTTATDAEVNMVLENLFPGAEQISGEHIDMALSLLETFVERQNTNPELEMDLFDVVGEMAVTMNVLGGRLDIADTAGQNAVRNTVVITQRAATKAEELNKEGQTVTEAEAAADPALTEGDPIDAAVVMDRVERGEHELLFKDEEVSLAVTENEDFATMTEDEQLEALINAAGAKQNQQAQETQQVLEDIAEAQRGANDAINQAVQVAGKVDLSLAAFGFNTTVIGGQELNNSVRVIQQVQLAIERLKAKFDQEVESSTVTPEDAQAFALQAIEGMSRKEKIKSWFEQINNDGLWAAVFPKGGRNFKNKTLPTLKKALREHIQENGLPEGFAAWAGLSGTLNVETRRTLVTQLAHTSATFDNAMRSLPEALREQLGLREDSEVHQSARELEKIAKEWGFTVELGIDADGKPIKGWSVEEELQEVDPVTEEVLEPDSDVEMTEFFNTSEPRILFVDPAKLGITDTILEGRVRKTRMPKHEYDARTARVNIEEPEESQPAVTEQTATMLPLPEPEKKTIFAAINESISAVRALPKSELNDKIITSLRDAKKKLRKLEESVTHPIPNSTLVFDLTTQLNEATTLLLEQSKVDETNKHHIRMLELKEIVSDMSKLRITLEGRKDKKLTSEEEVKLKAAETTTTGGILKRPGKGHKARLDSVIFLAGREGNNARVRWEGSKSTKQKTEDAKLYKKYEKVKARLRQEQFKHAVLAVQSQLGEAWNIRDWKLLKNWRAQKVAEIAGKRASWDAHWTKNETIDRMTLGVMFEDNVHLLKRLLGGKNKDLETFTKDQTQKIFDKLISRMEARIRRLNVGMLELSNQQINSLAGALRNNDTILIQNLDPDYSFEQAMTTTQRAEDMANRKVDKPRKTHAIETSETKTSVDKKGETVIETTATFTNAAGDKMVVYLRTKTSTFWAGHEFGDITAPTMRVDFSSTTKYGKTGSGDALKVINTVSEIIKNNADAHKPEFIFVTGSTKNVRVFTKIIKRTFTDVNVLVKLPDVIIFSVEGLLVPIEPEVVTDAITIAELALGLNAWSNRLTGIMDRTDWGNLEDGALPYGLLKDSLKDTAIKDLQIEEVFKEALTDESKLLDPVSRLMDLRFRWDGLQEEIIILMSQTSDVMHETFSWTAEALLESMKNRDDTNSAYSIYKALSTVDLLMEATRDIDTTIFKSKGKNGYKLELKKDRSIMWGTRSDYRKAVGEAMAMRYNTLLNWEQKRVRDILFGTEEAEPTSVTFLDTAETYLADIAVDEMGDGSKGYSPATVIGSGIIDLILGKKIGTKTEIVDVIPPTLTDAAQLKSPDPKKPKQTQDDKGSQRLLFPRVHGVNQFAPLHDWKMMQVIEDEVFRNRIRFALHVPITPELRAEWLSNTATAAREALYDSVDLIERKAPVTTLPRPSNRSAGSRLMTREDRFEMLYELMIDMPQATRKFIHDAVYDFEPTNYGEGKKYTPSLTTGGETAVPVSNVGWIAQLFRLRPELFADGAPFLKYMMKQSIGLEQKAGSFHSALDNFNYRDQKFQGFHLYWLLAKDWDTLVTDLNFLNQELRSETGDSGWNTDLEDYYINSGTFIASLVLGHVLGDSSQKKIPGAKEEPLNAILSKIIKMYQAVGFEYMPGRPMREIQAAYKKTFDQLQDDPRFEVIRDEFFKVGPLRRLYQGGFKAWREYWVGSKGIKGLARINEQFGTDLTAEDMQRFGEDVVFQATMKQGATILDASLGLSESLRDKVLERFSMPATRVGKLDAKYDSEATQRELKIMEEEFAARGWDDDVEIPKALVTIVDATNNLESRIKDMADKNIGISKKIDKATGTILPDYAGVRQQKIEEIDAWYRYAEMIRKTTDKEYMTQEEWDIGNEILLGRKVDKDGFPIEGSSPRMAWKDVQHLRAMNISQNVGANINMDHLQVQAAMLELQFHETDLEGFNNYLLYETFKSSHDANRPFGSVVDLINIGAHNVDASKVATKNFDQDTMTRYHELLEQYKGRENADILARAELFKEGKAPFGMWDIGMNKFHTHKHDNYTLEEDGSFPDTAKGRRDKKEYNKWVETEMLDLMIRDEMLFNASYGPIESSAYGKPITLEDGTIVDVFSEENPNLMFNEIVKRWKSRSAEADIEYLNLAGKVDTLLARYEALPIGDPERSAILTELEKIDKMHGIPVQSLMGSIDVGVREGLNRFMEELNKVAAVRTRDGITPTNSHSYLLGQRNSFPAGYAAFRPLIAQVAWENTGPLELRRRYYQDKVDSMESKLKLINPEGKVANKVSDLIAPDLQNDVNILAKTNIIYPEADMHMPLSLLKPRTETSARLAHSIKQNNDIFLHSIGLDISEDSSRNAEIHYLRTIDDLFGYINTVFTSEYDLNNKGFVQLLESAETKGTNDQEIAMNLFMALNVLGRSIHNVHRVPSSALDRTRNMLEAKGKGAPVSTKLVEGDIVTYMDVLKDGYLGENRLSNLLRVGLRAEEFQIIGTPKNDGERIVVNALREATLFIQSFDAFLLYYASSDQVALEQYFRDNYPEMLTAFKTGSWEAFNNKYEVETVHGIMREALVQITNENITNLDLILTVGLNNKKQLVIADFAHASRDIKVPVLATGIPNVSRQVVGSTIEVALTAEGLNQALDTLSNDPHFSAVEESYAQGRPFNPENRHADSNRLRQDLMYNETENRNRAILLREAMEMLATDPDAKERLDLVDEKFRETEGVKVSYLNARAYLNKIIEVSMYPGAAPIKVKVYEAAFLAPVMKVMHVISRSGSTAIDTHINGLIQHGKKKNYLSLKMLGFMLRNPEITSTQLAVILPQSKHWDESFNLATTALEEITKTIRWAQYSPTVKHLHQDNHPQGGWGTKANHIHLYTRSWFENMKRGILRDIDSKMLITDLKKTGHVDIYDKYFLSNLRTWWSGNEETSGMRDALSAMIDKDGNPMNTKLITFYDENLEALARLSFEEELNALIATDEDVSEPVDLIASPSDEKYRGLFTVDPARYKKYRNANHLHDDFRKETFYPHLNGLISSIALLESSKTISADTGAILRSVLGYWAQTAPEFLTELHITSDNLGGPKIALAEKWTTEGQKKFSLSDMDNAGTREADLKNVMVLNGMDPNEVAKMPELTRPDEWRSDTVKIIGLDIETNFTKDLNQRFPYAVILWNKETGTREVLQVAEDPAGFTTEESVTVLKRLEQLQQDGYKISTHNGNGFDLLTLGHHAQQPQLAGRIAYRSFDTMQMMAETHVEKPKFRLERLTSHPAINIGKKAETRQPGHGAAWSYVLWRTSLGYEVTAQDMIGLELDDATQQRWLEDLTEYKGDPTKARAELEEYVQTDGSLSAELLGNIITNEGRRVDGIEYLMNGIWHPIDITIPKAKASWELDSELGKMHHSIKMKNFHSRNSYTFADDSPAYTKKGYHIVLDNKAFANMDTLSAIDIIFHEFMEVAQMKFIKTDSVEYFNLVGKLREKKNQDLIIRITEWLNGKGVNVDAKIDYITNPDKPNEAIATLASYMLMSRILGQKDSIIADIEADLKKSSMWKYLRNVFKKMFSWMSDKLFGVSNIFISYADESPQEFRKLMSMMDAVFGLDKDGVRLPDVQNVDSGPRFMEEFRTYSSTDESIKMSDEEYLAKAIEKATLSRQRANLQATTDLNLQGEEALKLVERIDALDKILTKHSYENADILGSMPLEMMIPGRNLFGITREQRALFVDALPPSRIDGIEFDGRAVLYGNDMDAQIALLSVIVEGMSEYSGALLHEGWGGRLNQRMEDVWGGKKMQRFYKGMLGSWAGSMRTQFSQFDFIKMLTNMIVDGTNLTLSSVTPQPEGGQISTQTAKDYVREALNAVTTEFLSASDAFKKTDVYKKAKKKSERIGENGEQAGLLQLFQLDTYRYLISDKHDITGYNEETQAALKRVRDSYRSFVKDIHISEADKAGRLFMSDEVELVPALLSGHSSNGDVVSKSVKAIYKEMLLQKILDNSTGKDGTIGDGFVNPILLFASRLLPMVEDPKTLQSDLEFLNTHFPNYFKWLSSKAFDEYLKITRANEGDIAIDQFMELTTDSDYMKAWDRTVLQILRTYNHRRGSYKFSELGLPTSELKAFHTRYLSQVEHTIESGDVGKRLSYLSDIDLTTNMDIAKPWSSYNKPTKKDWTDVTDFLADTFFASISHRPKFIDDATWMPTVSEMLSNDSTRAEVASVLETNPARLIDKISKTVGHTAVEINMFAPITKTDLSMEEILYLAKLVIDPASSAGNKYALTDGNGKSLTGAQRTELKDSVAILTRKYSVLRGMANKFATSDDISIGELSKDAMWAIKVVYGTNLALATALVEGSMAGIIGTLGYKRYQDILLPVLSYFRSFGRDKYKKVALNSMYSLQLMLGRMTPSTIESHWDMADIQDARLTFSGQPSGRQSDGGVWSKWGRPLIQAAGNLTVRHAMHVQQDIRAHMDLQTRLELMDQIEGGGWRKMIDLLEGEQSLGNDAEAVARTLEQVDRIRKSDIVLDASENFYVRKDESGNLVTNEDGTTKQYTRVSDAIGAVIDTKDPIALRRLESAQNIGNHIDEVMRDFFEGTLQPYENYVTDDGNPYFETEDGDPIKSRALFDSFVQQLNERQEYFNKRNEKVIAQDITVYSDTHNIAGTLDIVTVNEETGSVHIYDIKTKRSGLQFWESTAFGRSDKSKWSDQLSLYALLMNETFGVRPDGITIMPVKVMYPDAVVTDSTSEAKLLPLATLPYKNRVKVVNPKPQTLISPPQAKGKMGNVEEMIRATETPKGVTDSRSVWKKIAHASGWGKKTWRTGMWMATHGLMTHQALDDFIRMDKGSREMFGHSDKWFHPYQMRQWLMTELDTDTEQGKADFDRMMKTWFNIRKVIGRHIDTVMMEPNVMDLNVTSTTMEMLLSQYRTYPMLYGHQRILRDSNRMDGFTWLTKVITTSALDMIYTLMTMMAGGYKVNDMIEDLEENPATFIGLLISRLPFFGFWGGALFEAMNAIRYGRGEFMAPISIAGVLKLMSGAVNVGDGAIREMIPGGKGWDDENLKNLINLTRIFPYLGESVVRNAMHHTLRSGNARGGYAAHGSGNYATFGLDDHDFQQDSRFIAEQLIRNIAPDLFPDDLAQLNIEDRSAIQNAFKMSPPVQPDVQPGRQTSLPRVSEREQQMETKRKSLLEIPDSLSPGVIAAPAGAFED